MNNSYPELFLQLLYDKYNDWIIPEDMQTFITNLIDVWVYWNEEEDRKELEELFIERFIPKIRSRALRQKIFNWLRLNYWPKFIPNPRTFCDYSLEYIQWRKGWSQLIIDWFDAIQQLIDTKYPDTTFKITYMKEKYWWLRFENYWWPDEIEDILYMMEDKSYTICDQCWKKWKLRDDLWWIRTLCSKHYKEMKHYKKMKPL